MNIKDIINKKSLGKSLTKEEINFFINGYCNETIPNYQASALLMAIKINGMNNKEIFYLTQAMLNSGEIIDLSDVGFCVDKHSTGGVSDSTTIAIIPICASVGVKMLKISGAGLGFTGGTADKLGAIPGFSCLVDIETAKNLVNENGGCIITSSANIAPADKKLYALRDITSTVESIPLIASSIMSKKLASGATAIVLDVKYGNGAFMKTKKDALILAKTMVDIGKSAGKQMDYCISDMNQPLGYNIGCKLEMFEAVQVLKGLKGPLYNSVIELSSKCISLGLNINQQKAKKLATEAISSGLAFEKFKQIANAQGAKIKNFDKLDIKPKLIVKATCNGVLNSVNCAMLGTIVGLMGGSRQTLDSEIDYNAGIKTFHKVGDIFNKGDVLFEIYAKTKEIAERYKEQIISCYTIQNV